MSFEQLEDKPQGRKVYGTKNRYDPLWEGPRKLQRRFTDFKSFITFIVYLLCLIGIAAFAFSNGEPPSQNVSDWEKTFSTFKTYAFEIFGFVALGVNLSLAFIILLRYHPKFVAYISMIFTCLVLLAISILMIHDYVKYGNKLLRVISMCMVFVASVITLILYKRIILPSCEVIGQSCEAFMYFPASLLFPILTFLLSVIVLIGLGTSSFYLYHIPKPMESAPAYLYFLITFNILSILYLINFIAGFTQMTLSKTFATWFWTLNKSYIPSSTLPRAIYTTARYHLGTIAFGSLVISTVECISFMFRIMAREAVKDMDEGYAVLAMCKCCCQVFIQCVEDFLNFVSRKAYIMCAVHGTDFIRSAKDAFNLIMRNILEVAVVSHVTGTIFLFGLFLTWATPIYASYLYFDFKYQDSDTLGQLVTATGVFISIFIFIIFSVLNTAIDTIFICCLEDYERNDGSVERPYFMSVKLKRLIFQ